MMRLPRKIGRLFLATIIFMINVRCGSGQSVVILEPADVTVVVGDVLSVDILVSNPGGSKLTFELEGLPTSAQAYPTVQGLNIQWAPLANEAQPGGTIYEVTVRAFADSGGSDQAHFTITALSDGGTPTFLTAAGYVVDLASEDRFSLLVEIKDDDSTNIEFFVVQDLPGAHWSRIDDRTHTVTWVPTAQQIEEKKYWSLVLGAADESHPTTFKVISIFLANAFELRDCPGTWPIISSYVAEFSPMGTLQFTAQATDPDSPIRSVVGVWRSIDQEGAEVATGVKSMLPGPDGYSGVVTPNEFGNSAVLAEVAFRVRDDDDQESSLCDHETRVPKAGEITVPISPGHCPIDAFGDPLGAPVRLEPGERNTLRLCPGVTRDVEVPVGLTDAIAAVARSNNPGTIRMELSGELSLPFQIEEGDDIVVVERYPMADSGPLRLGISRPFQTQTTSVDLWVSVTDTPCVPDGFEPDDSPELAPTMTNALGQIRRLCPGDRDIIRFQIFSDSVVTAKAQFEQLDGDIDLAILDADGLTPIRLAQANASDEVLKASLSSGLYYLEVSSHLSGAIPYILDFTVESGGTCLDDVYFPNQSYDEAKTLPESHLAGLVLCPGQTDFLNHEINDQESYHIEVDRTDGGGAPLQVALINAQGQPSGIGDGVLDTQPLPKGKYGIRLVSSTTETIPYSVFFQVTNHSTGCPIDRFAPNGSITSAALIGTGWTTRLLLCAGEDDYFAVKTAAPRAVRVLAFYATPGQPVGLEHVLANGVTAQVAENQGPWAVLETTVPSAGIHRFRIYPTTQATFYDLLVEFP